MCSNGKNDSHESHKAIDKGRRSSIKQILLAPLAALLPASLFVTRAEAGNGSCYLCDCPGYVDGYNYTCGRCGHSYDNHTLGGY